MAQKQQWQHLAAFVHSGKLGGVEGGNEHYPYQAGIPEYQFLDLIGQDGWELATVVGSGAPGAYKLYFKRPV